MTEKNFPEALAQYGLHHIGYVVADRQAAVAAFENSCGITQLKLISFRAGRTWLLGQESPAPYEMKIAMLTLPGHSTAIEIIEPLSEGPHMEFLQKTGGGIHHIGFDVIDAYDHWKEKLLAADGQPLFESETEDQIVGYRRCLYLAMPGGNVIEIKETPYFR